MSSRKRRRPRRNSPDYTAGGDVPTSSSRQAVVDSLYIQAHEATIIRNRPDLAEAVRTANAGGGKGGLIRWHGDSEKDIWVDRYDARLLLDSLPGASERRALLPPGPPSPTGWPEVVSSDAEETFLMTRDEAEDARREKRRKMLDTAREERLRAMREAEPEPEPSDPAEDKETWGDDDEEPESTIRTLMERTATHLAGSPNPGQLEMRILANHGADGRFAFLRGRWKKAWQKMKSEADERKKAQETASTKPGLVAYGSDSDSD